MIEELPERLLIGTGAYGHEALPTGEAVRRYSELDPRRTAAALHLTC